MSDLLEKLATNDYQTIYKRSLDDSQNFWNEIGELLSWKKKWTKTLNNSHEPFTKWYQNGKINACYNTIDRHCAEGKGSKTAIIFDSPLLNTSLRITYEELQYKVSRLAGVLIDLGVKKSTVVLIYMPAIPETVMAMLAVARLGAVHCVVFGGFGSCELATRIDDCKPKVIIAANCGVEPCKIIRYIDNLNEALQLATHKPDKCILYQRGSIEFTLFDDERYMDWDLAIENGKPSECVPIEANEPLYIIYSSDHIAIQRPIGGHLATLLMTMKIIYGMEPDDVWWTTSDFGWAFGHSYMLYGPLLYGMTTVIYEGKPTTTPDVDEYFRLIETYKINAILTIPTIIRMIKIELGDEQMENVYDLSSLKHIFVSGEYCCMALKVWSEKVFGVPVISQWWQSEIGHPLSANCVGIKNGAEFQKKTIGYPFFGFNIRVLRSDGSAALTGEEGRLVVKLPLPPGSFSTVYNGNERFIHTYFTKFPGYYDTMDVGYVNEQGCYHLTGRDDAIINIAGHRLSLNNIENVILCHPDVIDACVVVVPDPIKGEIPFCFYVRKEESILDEDFFIEEIIQMVRESIGPVASFKFAAPLSTLPKMKSGKICKKFISDFAKNKTLPIPDTIDDPQVFDEIKTILEKYGF